MRLVLGLDVPGKVDEEEAAAPKAKVRVDVVVNHAQNWCSTHLSRVQVGSWLRHRDVFTCTVER